MPFSQAARSWWPAARGHHRPVDLSASANPVWRAGPSLGTTRKHLRIFRLASTTHQFSAAEATSPSAPCRPDRAWMVAHPQPNLTPPGHDYLIAVDARDIPSPAKTIKLT